MDRMSASVGDWGEVSEKKLRHYFLSINVLLNY